MNIKEMRIAMRMTQVDFSRYYGIPLGTLRNWEQGATKPPEYVMTMLDASVRRNGMINIETIKLIQVANDLAKLSKNGIENVCDCHNLEDAVCDHIVYDSQIKNSAGYEIISVFVHEDPDDDKSPIISECFGESGEYDVGVVFLADEIGEECVGIPPFVRITFPHSSSVIEIHDGNWSVF